MGIKYALDHAAPAKAKEKEVVENKETEEVEAAPVAA